jgi:hypothetical protein
MRREATGKLLRIFVGESDRYENRPLFVAVVDALRAAGFGGATAFKGIEGYGASGRVHSARAADLSTNLPVLIEAVEEEAKILSFMPTLQTMVASGLVTLENLTLVRVSKDGTP